MITKLFVSFIIISLYQSFSIQNFKLKYTGSYVPFLIFNLYPFIFKNSSNNCKVAILFSGGIDCTVLALLADLYVPKHQPIDLLNVAFPKNNKNNYDLPDRKTGLIFCIEY